MQFSIIIRSEQTTAAKSTVIQNLVSSTNISDCFVFKQLSFKIHKSLEFEDPNRIRNIFRDLCCCCWCGYTNLHHLKFIYLSNGPLKHCTWLDMNLFFYSATNYYPAMEGFRAYWIRDLNIFFVKSSKAFKHLFELIFKLNRQKKSARRHLDSWFYLTRAFSEGLLGGRARTSTCSTKSQLGDTTQLKWIFNPNSTLFFTHL